MNNYSVANNLVAGTFIVATGAAAGSFLATHEQDWTTWAAIVAVCGGVLLGTIIGWIDGRRKAVGILEADR